MSEVSVRRGKVEDAQRVHEIVQAGYRGEGGWTGESHLVGGERILLSELQSLLADESTVILVAEDDATRRVQGCIRVEQLNENECEFGLFSVDTEIQAKGIGSKLISEAENFAKTKLNATTGVLHVLAPRVELIAFYERRGYVPNGIEIPFPYTNSRGEWIKVDSLHLREFKKPLN